MWTDYYCDNHHRLHPPPTPTPAQAVFTQLTFKYLVLSHNIAQYYMNYLISSVRAVIHFQYCYSLGWWTIGN